MNFVDFVDVLIFSFLEFVDDFVFDFSEEIFGGGVNELLDISHQLRRHHAHRKWRARIPGRRRRQLEEEEEGMRGKVE